MQKNKLIFQKIFHAVILTAFCVTQLFADFYSLTNPCIAYADTANEPVSIALPYVTELSINTKDTTVRVYQSGTDACSVPIHVYTDCTLILDHVINAADLTIADGCTVTIQLIGENQIQNLKACGGFQTSVTICGTSSADTLHAEQIACAPGGSATTSAQLSFLSCSIFSKSIGCGMDGSDTSYWSSSATIARATPGSNASPLITIQHAKVEVEGDLACGGDGVCSTGTWSACTSHGGSSGEVHIEDSEVSVTGDMSVGGKGGNGDVSSSYYKCVAGNTKRASDVRIMQQSNVTVNGNVATSKNLPGMSDGGTQRGLDGATVTVSDSILSAKDIASGGSGHQTIRYNIYSGAGTSYDVCGTAGGNGGTILASNATIQCETAVCGANAGDYMNYEVSMYGTTSGDADCVHHPLDGNGGKIISQNSYFTIHTHAGAKGSRWNGYANPSTYSDSQFLGGSFNGTLYGNVITTDMTALVESETQKGFVASTEIRNSLEQACAKCTIQTGSELAEQVITIQANDIAQQTKLDTSGTLYTYLAIGKEKLTIHGSKSYLATVMVKRSEALNIFRLTPYGWISIDTDSVLIEENGYTYQNEHFAHQSSYTITGESAQNDVCVMSGVHHIFADAATFDSLEVKGSSNVILHLNGHTTISNIWVDEAATLQIVGNGSLTVQTLGHLNAPSGTILIKEGTVNVKNLGSSYGGKEITVSNPDQLTVENCHTTLRNEQGERLFLLTIGFTTSGTYGLKLNQLQEEIQIDERLEYSMLLPENVYQLELSQGSFSYKGEILLNKPQYIFQSDLMLSIDNSMDTILIEDGNLTFDAQTIQAENSITIYQSDIMIHPIIVSQASVNITLDQVRADTPLHLCDDFQGCIQNQAGRTILPVTIHTSYPLQEVFVVLDSINYRFVTDENGDFVCLLSEGSHSLKIQIADVVYEAERSWNFSDLKNSSIYSLEQLMEEQSSVSEQDQNSTESSDKETDGTSTDTGNSSTKPSGAQTSQNPTGDTTSDSNTSNSSTSPTTSSSSSSSSTTTVVMPQENAKQSLTFPKLPDITALRDSELFKNLKRILSIHSGNVQENEEEITIQSSLKNLKLLPVSAPNTYRLYSKNKVTIKLNRKEGYRYYYQIVKKGEKRSSKKWIELTGSKITVKQSGCHLRVVIKAVAPNQKIILRKTNGFFIHRSLFLRLFRMF